jgi:hypothetical protein
MLFGLRNLPSGAKAQNFSGEFTARLKSCPFKIRFSRMQNLHAIALGDLVGFLGSHPWRKNKKRAEDGAPTSWKFRRFV